MYVQAHKLNALIIKNLQPISLMDVLLKIIFAEKGKGDNSQDKNQLLTYYQFITNASLRAGNFC